MSPGEIVSIAAFIFTVFSAFGSLVWWAGSKIGNMDRNVTEVGQNVSELATAWDGFVHGRVTTVPCTERDGRMDKIETSIGKLELDVNKRLERHSDEIKQLRGSGGNEQRTLEAMDPTGEHTERVLRRQRVVQRPATETE